MEEYLRTLGYEGNFNQTMMVGALVMMRVTIVVNLIPFLFGNPVPNIVRNIMALLLTLLIYPVASAMVPPEAFGDPLWVVSLFLKEAFYGAAIGIAGMMMFYGFEAAGRVIDNQRGASMAQMFSPQTGHQVTVFSQFTFQLGIVLFLSIGGHQLFLSAFVESFQLLPIHEMPVHGPTLLTLMSHFIDISGSVFLIAAQLSAPIIISIFVVDIILGVINRISPAVNVLTLGFTIRGITGVLIVFVAITVLGQQMGLISMQTTENVRKTIHFLAGS